MKKAVYFFCPDPALDAVATGVLKILKERLPLVESGLVVDGLPAYTYTDERGDGQCVRQKDSPLSFDFE